MKSIKTLIILISLLAISFTAADAQIKDSTQIESNFDILVNLINKRSYQGSLVELRKYGILLQTKEGVIKPLPYNDQLLNFKIRRKNAVSDGVLIGGILGFSAGATYGYFSIDSNDLIVSKSEAAAVVGFGGLMIGGIIGGIMGARSVKINLNGNSKLNEAQLQKLEKYNLRPY